MKTPWTKSEITLAALAVICVVGGVGYSIFNEVNTRNIIKREVAEITYVYDEESDIEMACMSIWDDGTCRSWASGKNGKYFEITELKVRPRALDVNK